MKSEVEVRHARRRVLSDGGHNLEEHARRFRDMDDEDLGLHFLKHVCREDEAWRPLLPAVFERLEDGDVKQTLAEIRAALEAVSGTTNESWGKLINRCRTTSRGTRRLFRACEALVEKHPELVAPYREALAHSIKQAATLPRHYVQPADEPERVREGYLDDEAILTTIAPDRTRRGRRQDVHLVLTGFRADRGRTTAERLDRMKRYGRRRKVNRHVEATWASDDEGEVR